MEAINKKTSAATSKHLMTKQYLSYTAVLFFFVQIVPSFAQSPDRPNILFIMADDFTAQAWGIYGGILQNNVKNDQIKRLATGGAKLDNVFCTNSICVPSRASIMTGQYSHRNGVYTLSDSLNPSLPNIAKTLQQAGYQTGLFGKWHLKTRPSGFDDFMVLPRQGQYHNPYFKSSEDWHDDNKGLVQKKGFSTDVITDMSIDWLDNRQKNRPFFLMCHYKATHEPFDFADRYKDLYDGVVFPEPKSLNDWGPETTGRAFPGHQIDILGERYEKSSNGDFWTTYPELPFEMEGLDSLQARKKIYQKFIRDFLRSGAGVNDNLGRLLDYLDQNGLTENTVVIFTSDQGYFLGEHAFFDKRMMLEESLRMPFLIRYPHYIPGGATHDEIILNIDFPALFADYAGVPIPDYIQGESFRPIVEGVKVRDWRKAMYYRYWTHSPTRPAHLGIRTDRYKLIYYYGRPMEGRGDRSNWTTPGWDLYDLKKDPYEVHNVYGDKKYKRATRRLKKNLKKLKMEVEDDDEVLPY